MKKLALTGLLFLSLAFQSIPPRNVPSGPPLRSSHLTTEGVRMEGRGVTAPFDFDYYGGTFQSDLTAMTDNIFSWRFNFDGRATDQPIYNEQFESRFVVGAPPGGLLERHGNFTSLDRSVIYRPWNFNVDLNDNEASMALYLKDLQVLARGSNIPLVQLSPKSGQITLRMPDSPNPLQVLGGPGNIHLRINPEQAVFLWSARPATALLPVSNSPALYLSGYYWDGVGSAGVNSSLSTIVEGVNKFRARLQVGNSEFNFHYNGALEAQQFISAGRASWTSGTGIPIMPASNGSLYSRTDGRGGLYVRENDLWILK